MSEEQRSIYTMANKLAINDRVPLFAEPQQVYFRRAAVVFHHPDDGASVDAFVDANLNGYMRWLELR